MDDDVVAAAPMLPLAIVPLADEEMEGEAMPGLVGVVEVDEEVEEGEVEEETGGGRACFALMRSAAFSAIP
jgi:hypothetical protein